MQELSLEILFKKQKLLSLRKPTVLGYKTGSTYKVPVTAEVKPQPASNVRKISPQELQKRREKGLCFKCGDKFGLGHQRAMKHLNFMLLDEDPDPGGDIILAELEEEEDKVGSIVETSLYALSSCLQRKTITLQSQLCGHLMNILVDTGSSDSYLNSKHGLQIALRQQQVEPFSMIIADGSTLTSTVVCPKVKWEVQGSKFCYDLKSMNVGVWDMVLGVDDFLQSYYV